MKLQELKEMHFKKLAGDTFGYAQTWATWTVEGEATITIYLVEGDTALIQFSAMNDATGKENNKWLTRKVKDGRIQFNGNLYLVSYPENMVEEVAEEAPAVKEFSIYSKNDTHIVTTPNGEYALIIGQTFNVDYKDEHGEYHIENLLFVGSGPANDCLLFKNDRGDILHMDPLKVQRVTIPFPFKTEREKRAHETVFGVFNDVKEQNEVDLFKRYHELLMKSLERGALTAEERVEMVDLQEELNLKDRSRLYQLHKAAFEPKNKKLTFAVRDVKFKDDTVNEGRETALQIMEERGWNEADLMIYSTLRKEWYKDVKIVIPETAKEI